MGLKLKIEIDTGARYVTEADIDRARTAAMQKAAESGITDADAARKAMTEYEAMVEAGEVGRCAWDDIQSAANIALTEGWHNPEGAYCSVVLA